MPQLIHMRQRLKAIETIEKITHAMQLISMSTHFRLRDKKAKIEAYQETLKNVFLRVIKHVPAWHNPLLSPTIAPDKRPLIILIGSQKGLCGTFNIHLFENFEKDIKKGRFPYGSLITIGKKATEYVQTHKKMFPYTLETIGSYDTFTWTTSGSIVQSLLDVILTAKEPFSQVIVYSNYPVSFFLQRTQTTTLIPFEAPSTNGEETVGEDFEWEDDPTTIMDALAHQYLQATLHYILIQSLLAEQSARFISMDNATRNAHRLQETMRLHYNKLRQAKITKELTELSSSFQMDLGS